MRRRASDQTSNLARCYGVMLILATCGASAQMAAPVLDPAIVELLDAEPAPQVLADPVDRYLLLVRARQLLPIEHLARPAVELAGRRVDPATAAPHAPIEYFALTLVDLVDGTRQEIPLPRGAVLGYPQWAPDGSRFAFSLTRPGSKMELWIGEPTEGRARPLLTQINGVRSSACGFTPRSELLCRRIVGELPDATEAGSAYGGRYVHIAGLELGPEPLNDRLVSGLLESQLELIDSASGQRHRIGEPAAFERVAAAPGAGYLLVERILRPYPRYSGIDRVTTVTEIWNRFGDVVATVPDSARSVDWQATRSARLVWVETRAGQDYLMSLDPPFTAAPQTRFLLPGRFAGLRWVGDRNAALVTAHFAERRETQLWYVPMHGTGAGDAHRLLTYSSTNPRMPLMRINHFGADAVGEHDGRILVRGHETVEDRRHVFLDRVALESGEVERSWVADGDEHETLVDVLGDDGQLLLVRREGSMTPPNYFIRDAGGRTLLAVTDDVHAMPGLVDAERIRLEYERTDGTQLSASLYLPPGTGPEERLPMIVWAYPQRVLAGSNARLPDTTDQFPTFDRAFRQFFLLRGYAVLDDVSMPVVGDDSTANDTFIDQIVANAAAAVAAAAETGHVDVLRVGVAGHSYGAFMVANLLAHSRIFSAGVALSGAYNRTLTPFGFQTERRTLWDAPATYLAMSPVIYADRVEAPLLLVHGLLDDNAGTAPIQSTQFLRAIRGNGGNADLLLLPWEGHEYRARESVLRTAAGMLDWFDRYMGVAGTVSGENTGASLRP